jgi:hypothetical protein
MLDLLEILWYNKRKRKREKIWYQKKQKWLKTIWKKLVMEMCEF